MYVFKFPFTTVGIYLPLLWESSFCWRSPIALAYTRGHFSALVSIAHRDYSTKCVSTDDWSNKMSQDNHVTYLPLVNADGKLLPLHFLSELEVGYSWILFIIIYYYSSDWL